VGIAAGGLIYCWKITAPRVPCAVLAARDRLSGFVRNSSRSCRVAPMLGYCARVFCEEVIAMQDDSTHQPFPIVDDIFRYWHSKGYNAVSLACGLASPIALAACARPSEKQLLGHAQARTGQLPGSEMSSANSFIKGWPIWLLTLHLMLGDVCWSPRAIAGWVIGKACAAGAG